MAVGDVLAERAPEQPGDRVVPGWLRRTYDVALLHPVLLSMAVALVLHLAWVLLIANGGGDLAAQDAWAAFARDHPGSAYDLAWYGGMHPVSYSAVSPYVMAVLGVRTTMVLAGTVSAGLLALLLVRSRQVPQPVWPALYGAFAFTCNAVSGRVTFGLGVMFALGAVAVVFVWPARWWTTRLGHRLVRGGLVALLSGLATGSSPVAGLFLGVVAGALWLARRRAAAYALGLPPVAVVGVSALLFPFSGVQPMAFASAILPVALGIACVVLVPEQWRAVRLVAGLYVLGVLAVALVPSQIGTNVGRLGLVFGGVVLVAAVTRRGPRLVLVTMALVATTWQVAVAARDVQHNSSADAWSLQVGPLVDQLDARGADLARVEVVPTQSHREASSLAPHVNLARGWNRQADAERNPLFYDDVPLTAASYRAWLDRWAVSYVFLPASDLDPAAAEESTLIAGGLSYLREVWSGGGGHLYAVRSPHPLADAPAEVTQFDSAEIVIDVPAAGSYVVRIPSSPWLTLLDASGDAIAPPQSDTADVVPVNVDGCLGREVVPATEEAGEDTWTVLEAPRPGTYRIAAPYSFQRGTACPTPG